MAHRYPDSAVFYRALDKSLPLIERAEGCRLYDDKGRDYIDACGGAFVANIGHGVREIGEAVAAQMGKVAYVNGTAFTNEASEELASRLAALSPKGLDKSYFLNSGSEAVEAALKLARQYWVERGMKSKSTIIARNPGYHGNTLLALSASARPHYKKLFGDWLIDVVMIDAPYAYRCPCAGAADCPACTGAALEQAILEAGAANVAAFIAEPVGGSSTGASVPRPDYYKRIREVCDRHGVLFIADEVLCGAGRTGKWLGLEHFRGAAPDIVTMGKGLSGGYLPLSAVLTSEKILEPLAKGAGALKHAQTFSHNPASCAAGVAALKYIEKHALVARAAKTGAILKKRLDTLLDLPAVGDVRGLGMLYGVELVADKKSKKPFARSEKLAERLVAAGQDAGIVLWPNVGQADGENGDLVMIAPPFTISDADVEELVARLRAALEKTAGRSKAAGGIS